MKVLIVDAFAGSASGRRSFAKFDEAVRAAFETVGRREQGRTEFIVRHFRKGLEVRRETQTRMHATRMLPYTSLKMRVISPYGRLRSNLVFDEFGFRRLTRAELRRACAARTSATTTKRLVCRQRLPSRL